MATAPSDNFDFQNFYSATLTSDITAGDLTIPLDIAPTPTEGVLIIDPDAVAPEVIFYTSKGASSVTCPADGRGWDSSSATTHGQGTTVIMAPTAYAWRMLKSGSLYDSYRTGWVSLGVGPNTVTANGNRSYNLVFSGTNLTDRVSNGMRLKLPRTVTPPTQNTSLNGTTQYYSKSSPAGITFTDDFTVSAWVKLNSYGSSADQVIASRYNGTSGWQLYVTGSAGNTGTVTLIGFNAGAANSSYVRSYRSVPLGKWVHIAAQLDMSSFTATTTTSYVMIDGVNVPSFVSRSGTNPTALVQAGNLEIGSTNSGTLPFNGKLAQVAIYNAKVTQATILAAMNQTLTGSETSLATAYTFNNSINDLSANANNLTANGSAVATNVDSPFTATEYGIVMASSFSTNTTLTVQVPESYSLPTTGGVSAISYSSHRTPYGFPGQKSKWTLQYYNKIDQTQSSPVSGTWYNIGMAFTVPIGEWNIAYESGVIAQHATNPNQFLTLSTTNNSETDTNTTTYAQTNGVTAVITPMRKSTDVSLSVATPYYLNMKTTQGSSTSIAITGSNGPSSIIVDNAYL